MPFSAAPSNAIPLHIAKRLRAPLAWLVPIADAPALIAGFHDVAMMGKPVQKGGGNLGVTCRLQ